MPNTPTRDSSLPPQAARLCPPSPSASPERHQTSQRSSSNNTHVTQGTRFFPSSPCVPFPSLRRLYCSSLSSYQPSGGVHAAPEREEQVDEKEQDAASARDTPQAKERKQRQTDSPCVCRDTKCFSRDAGRQASQQGQRRSWGGQEERTRGRRYEEVQEDKARKARSIQRREEGKRTGNRRGRKR